MVVVLRFVDKYGIVKERFVGLVHVPATTPVPIASLLLNNYLQIFS